MAAWGVGEATHWLRDTALYALVIATLAEEEHYNDIDEEDDIDEQINVNK